jgi:hypothetical protein
LISKWRNEKEASRRTKPQHRRSPSHVDGGRTNGPVMGSRTCLVASTLGSFLASLLVKIRGVLEIAPWYEWRTWGLRVPREDVCTTPTTNCIFSLLLAAAASAKALRGEASQDPRSEEGLSMHACAPPPRPPSLRVRAPTKEASSWQPPALFAILIPANVEADCSGVAPRPWFISLTRYG